MDMIKLGLSVTSMMRSGGTVGAMESVSQSNNIYHIGNDQEITMEELTKFIGNLLRYEGDYEFAMTYPGSVSRRCPNIDKAVENLAYKPEVGLERCSYQNCKVV